MHAFRTWTEEKLTELEGRISGFSMNIRGTVLDTVISSDVERDFSVRTKKEAPKTHLAARATQVDDDTSAGLAGCWARARLFSKAVHIFRKLPARARRARSLPSDSSGTGAELSLRLAQ